ncbi:MAG: hypothetical protein OMM_03491 [Candidatus Magnetoglobus multicellularis str. Araruama]|uniref:Uncharacterized protein n=1 Tax=Candidatus Magnetoglobus multicellularis str. Araruama TaxID=890399 RepID=A0A1V1P5Q9_9BACT|nr:MAG: hypothetical protein OMM_03491 [Candidatus Magnetoglobus multicellularis str. Araruama]
MKTDHKKNYHVVFNNRYVSNIDPKIAQRNFVLQFKIPANATKRIFSGKRIRIKKGISQQSALKVQDKLFQMGILCDIELDATPVAKQTKPAVKQLASQPKHKAISADSDADEDDEDDEDVEADFDLADILMQAGSTEIDTKNTKSIIEVIKCHENNIIDIQYLQKKQKYFDTNSHFCLAEHDRNQNAYFYFDDFIQGSIHNADQTTIETEAMRTSDNLSKQSKRIYRSIIPDDGYVALSDDLHTYYLRKKHPIICPLKQFPKSPNHMQ